MFSLCVEIHRINQDDKNDCSVAFLNVSQVSNFIIIRCYSVLCYSVPNLHCLLSSQSLERSDLASSISLRHELFGLSLLCISGGIDFSICFRILSSDTFDTPYFSYSFLTRSIRYIPADLL